MSCKNLKGGFFSDFSVSTGFLIMLPTTSCVFLITVVSISSAILKITQIRISESEYMTRTFRKYLFDLTTIISSQPGTRLFTQLFSSYGFYAS